MLFHKEKHSAIKPFKKERLSQLAIDHFVESYPSDNGDFSYTLQTGKKAPFNAALIFRTNGARGHFAYLLGQTYPYHASNTMKKYPIGYLALTLDDNQKPINWTTDSKVLAQFVNIATLLGYMELNKDEKGNLSFYTVPSVKPVTHTDD